MKKRRLPKKPKQSSGLHVWENWHKRVSEVKKHNSRVIADKNKKKRLIEKARNTRL